MKFILGSGKFIFYLIAAIYLILTIIGYIFELIPTMYGIALYLAYFLAIGIVYELVAWLWKISFGRKGTLK